jgi:hypothetical protein
MYIKAPGALKKAGGNRFIIHRYNINDYFMTNEFRRMSITSSS